VDKNDSRRQWQISWAGTYIFFRFSTNAFAATITVLKDINTAPTAGWRVMSWELFWLITIFFYGTKKPAL